MKAQKVLVAGVALAALATAAPGRAKSKQAQAQAPTVTEVIVYLKEELNAFNAYERPKVYNSKRVCGGAITLRLSRFDVEMTTVTSSDASFSAGATATVPLGPVTVGGSYGKGGSKEQSQTLNLSFDPVPLADLEGKASVSFFPNGEPMLIPFEPGAVSNSLINLEQSLRDAGSVEPCFQLLPSDKAKQAVTMGFSLAKSKKTGFNFSFLIFSVGSSKSKGSQNINTITAHFEPVRREGGEPDILKNKPPK